MSNTLNGIRYANMFHGRHNIAGLDNIQQMYENSKSYINIYPDDLGDRGVKNPGYEFRSRGFESSRAKNNYFIPT